MIEQDEAAKSTGEEQDQEKQRESEKSWISEEGGRLGPPHVMSWISEEGGRLPPPHVMSWFSEEGGRLGPLGVRVKVRLGVRVALLYFGFVSESVDGRDEVKVGANFQGYFRLTFSLQDAVGVEVGSNLSKSLRGKGSFERPRFGLLSIYSQHLNAHNRMVLAYIRLVVEGRLQQRHFPSKCPHHALQPRASLEGKGDVEGPHLTPRSRSSMPRAKAKADHKAEPEPETNSNVAMLGPPRGDGAVMLSFNSAYTFSITNLLYTVCPLPYTLSSILCSHTLLMHMYILPCAAL